VPAARPSQPQVVTLSEAVLIASVDVLRVQESA